MSVAFAPDAVITEATGGQVLHAYGDEVRVYLDGAQTEGRLVVFTALTPPGGGPPPHYHENEDEWFFVVAGDFEFLAGGEWRPVGVHGAVFAPRLSVHAYRNVGATPGRLLIHAAPAGFEIFFAESAAEFAKSERPDKTRLVEIGLAHGIHFV
ncbi:cupin domain-containing protein [Salinisphaera hydrothermalis]|uniref:Cupin domain-containing protein n=1 Tax=Salinisphaera hydrothermalis (strain C41B8) TaxID=1304275 RepID=A0A084IJ74_SALHC|nr:cupin domain-containing protein [Salinisphaera hydrothermalis]KEZ76758.1 cupin domain-containing protein [Salinisphaera hydrothermalis C41B8]